MKIQTVNIDMEGGLECTKCGSIVCVESNWYGLSRRFKFECKCNELDILSNASYIETFDEAISRRKEWKRHLTTASTRLAGCYDVRN